MVAICFKNSFASLKEKWNQLTINKSLNKYVVIPVTSNNPTIQKVILVAKFILAIASFILFCGAVDMTINSATLLKRGVGLALTYAFFKNFITLVDSITEKIFFTKPHQLTEEETLFLELNSLDQESFNAKLDQESGIRPEEFSSEAKALLAQESPDGTFQRGLIKIFVRFLFLKKRYNEALVKISHCVSQPRLRKKDKEKIEEIKLKYLLESLKIKIEVVKALIVLKNPLIQDLDEIGEYIQVLEEESAIDFIQSDLPFFFSRNGSLENLEERDFISFDEVERLNFSDLAEKILNFST